VDGPDRSEQLDIRTEIVPIQQIVRVDECLRRQRETQSSLSAGGPVSIRRRRNHTDLAQAILNARIQGKAPAQVFGVVGRERVREHRMHKTADQAYLSIVTKARAARPPNEMLERSGRRHTVAAAPPILRDGDTRSDTQRRIPRQGPGTRVIDADVQVFELDRCIQGPYPTCTLVCCEISCE